MTFSDLGCSPNCNATIDTNNTNIMSLLMTSQYTGTITQGTGKAFNIGSDRMGLLEQKGGNLVGSDATINVDGSVQLLKGQFTATSGLFDIHPMYGYNAYFFRITPANLNFSHNNGTVRLWLHYGWCAPSPTSYISQVDVVSANFYNLTLQGQGNCSGIISFVYFWPGPNIHGLYHQTGPGGWPYGTLNLYGNYVFDTANWISNGALLRFVGSGNQTYSTIDNWSYIFNYFEIDKPSGAVMPADTNKLSIVGFKLINGTISDRHFSY